MVHENVQHLAARLAGEGRLSQAKELYAQLCRDNPQNADAWSTLGTINRRLGDLEQAESCYREALRCNPRQPLVLLFLGSCLQQRKHFEEAQQRYRQALTLKPDLVEAIGRLADLCERSHQINEAEVLVRRGLVLDPACFPLLLTQARLKQRSGQLSEAIRILERVLEFNPEPGLLGETHTRLGYLYDRAGDYGRAFTHFDTGNRVAAVRFQRRGIDKRDYLRQLDRLSGLLDDDLTHALPVQDLPETAPSPVFLIGFPRSGTTLLEQILDSHPQLKTVEEKPAVNTMVEKLWSFAGNRVNPLVTLAPQEVTALRQAYFEVIDKFAGNRTNCILIDKFPLNIAAVHVIWRVFPEARFILALRHPCDVCLSCFMHSFGENIAMANFLSMEDIVGLYTRIMGFWRQCARILPLRYHAVRYEDLVDDLEDEVRRLLIFLGVDWDAAVLEYNEHARARGMIDTPSYQQVTQPIYKYARYRWQRYADHFAPYMGRLTTFIEYFGYHGTDGQAR